MCKWAFGCQPQRSLQHRNYEVFFFIKYPQINVTSNDTQGSVGLGSGKYFLYCMHFLLNIFSFVHCTFWGFTVFTHEIMSLNGNKSNPGTLWESVLVLLFFSPSLKLASVHKITSMQTHWKSFRLFLSWSDLYRPNPNHLSSALEVHSDSPHPSTLYFWQQSSV